MQRERLSHMNIALLEHMIGIPSMFPDETALGDLLYAELQAIGWTVTKQQVADHRFNVLAECGTGDRALMFYGHLDTVPAYGAWDSDPYVLTPQGDRLIGLGASDMKGGLYVILEAARDLTLSPDRKVKIAFCVDEENESVGAYALSADPFLDDVELIISAEIGDAATRQPQDIPCVVLGRRGRVGLTISVPGISAHGATPEQGVSAILEAYRFIEALAAMPMPSHPKLGQGTQYIQEIQAKSGSLSLPDRCDLYLSRLLVPPETPESALQEVQRYIARLYAQQHVVPRQGKRAVVTFAERGTPYYRPYITDETAPPVKKFLHRLTTKHFPNVSLGYGRSVADENIFGGINAIPTVTLGPRGGNEHSANEWVSHQSLARLIPVYRDLMQNLEI
ncbi:M20/M25/M40 family metallo-hydrolase [candidate division KSB3 bacterium]|uniref:M20/M25/M40 family metallo-hydrolase n=1 Tax=candidate division KSB3 bacterium TaxID=2044937 RepID=A0A9D5Q548_9BACT|nr:M20/M25/M40 family metallo-hydrolase [candidate division KSB3 bacterium]MBD3324210.1 M20/M25/M40 family metallo-hydrolase [candidate division KSB3 bacterium]